MSPGQWELWLISLQDATLSFDNSVHSASNVINDLLSSAKRGNRVYIPEPIAPPKLAPHRELQCRAMEGLFNGQVFSGTGTNVVTIREPSPWNPAADAFFSPPRHPKNSAIAPRNSLTRRVTAAEVLATIVADLPTPAYEHHSAPPIHDYASGSGMPVLHYVYGYHVDSVG